MAGLVQRGSVTSSPIDQGRPHLRCWALDVPGRRRASLETLRRRGRRPAQAEGRRTTQHTDERQCARGHCAAFSACLRSRARSV